MVIHMSEVYVDGIRYLPERTPTKKTQPLYKLLVAAREAKGESLNFVAKKTDIGISHLWTIEYGETMPRLHILQKLLKYYGISFEEIADEN